jgi:hypothetical protein
MIRDASGSAIKVTQFVKTTMKENKILSWFVQSYFTK